MADTNSFAKLVPGFEFLQSLTKNAGQSIPAIGHWVAPTLNPDEIEKRIEELRTVKFWLEQNGRMLDATIQALEVQRMTLSTLQTMNVQMGDLREAMTIRKPAAPAASPTEVPAASATSDVAASAMAAATSAAAAFANAFQFSKAASAPAAQQAAAPEPATTIPTPSHPSGASGHAPTPTPTPEAAAGAAANKPGAVDPMQWWGALTKQFTALAASALQDSAASAAVPPTATPESKPDAAPTRATGRAPAPRAPAKRAAPGAAPAESVKDSAGARKKVVRKTLGR